MTHLVVAEIVPRNIVVQQSNSPIRIESYRAQYKTDTGLRHTIKYQNRSGQKVVAIRFGMLSFDLFHKFLGKTTGTNVQDMGAGKSEEGFWMTDSQHVAAFHVGIAWVDSIRMEDGTIWLANDADVLAEARREDKDFDPAHLKLPPVLK
ncbi:MAG: hypothetical protein ACRD2N_24980 [Vicinamibacterales bacterium]